MLTDAKLHLAIAFCFVATWVIAEILRRNAVKLGLVQIPNERSSHAVPTPSGGGAAIALVSVGVGLFLGTELLWPILACALAALLGFLDDRLNLSPRFRLVGHFAIIAIVTISLLGTRLAQAELPQAYMLILLVMVVVAGVWWLNLFNFMDGIDGLASSQSIFMTVSGLTLATSAAVGLPADALLTWNLVVLAACAGFIVLNWPPARIFMGDAGSNFLAVAIFSAFLGLAAASRLEIATCLILSALFASDATVTLVSRLLSGESGFKAHRLHAYQKISRGRGGHLRATSIYLAINLLWIYPLAYLAQAFGDIGWWLAILAYCPIIAFCISIRAGRTDT